MIWRPNNKKAKKSNYGTSGPFTNGALNYYFCFHSSTYRNRELPILFLLRNVFDRININ